MKKIISILVLLLVTATVSAQKLNYQAVVRDSHNRLVVNTEVVVAVTITYSSGTYTETLKDTTNANGLMSLEIGGASGFDAIDWRNAWIKTVITIPGDGTVEDQVQVTATPLALYANYAADVSSSAPTITDIHTDMDALGDRIAGDSLLLANRIDNLDFHLNDTLGHYLMQEVQELSVGNDTLYLTGGSWVKLPQGFSGDYNDLTHLPDLNQYATNVHLNDTLKDFVSKTDLCTTIENTCTNVPLKNDNNTFTGDNTFTGGDNDFTGANSITVPSKFDIHNPPTSSTCTQDAVNICDLIAVFDSLNRKIDKLTERINQLEAANCPILGTVNVSDTTFGSATLSATIGNYDPLTVKQFGFLISTVPINGYESAIAHSVATQSAGVFTMNIAGLQPNTTYYVKPYVLNDTVRCTQDTMVGMQNTWTTDEFVVTLSETSICLGESVTVSATSTTIPNIGTVSYTWSTGADVPSITATPDKIGDTTFTVSATYGGYTATASATVTVKPMPDATITSDPDPAYYEGSIPVQLTAAETAAGATFAWDTVPANALLMSTDRSIYVQPEAPTDYKVVVTLDGCVSESTITVMTRQCPTLTKVTTTEGSTIPTRTTFSSAITNFTGTIQDLGFLLTLDESWTGVVDTLRFTGVSFPLNVGPTDFPFSKDTVLTSGLLYHVRAFATTDPSICPVGYVDGEAVPYKVEAPSPISLTGNDSICGGEEITLTAPDGYNSYSWSNGKNTQSITVKPYGTTVYTVTADGTAFSRAVTVLQPVTIYGNPGNNANELVFDVRKVPGAHYEWKLGNNVIPNSDTNVVTVSADVTGSPKCYVTVTLGHCSVSDSAKVATVVNARDLCGITTVTDHEGNRYNVVAFENTYNFIDNAHNNDLLQCWTKENMRAVTSPSTGTYLVREVGRYEPVSWTGKIAAWPVNDSLHYAPMNYGVLYNWNAALDLYHRGYGELSVNSDAIRKFNFLQGFPRGICPLGWHVARSSEWTAVEAPLANRTFDQLEAISGPRSVNYLGSKMASGIWSSSVSSCRTGDNNCSYRNVSDLSVLPAGTNNDVYVSSWAYFWTSESSYWNYNSTRYDTYASYLQFNGSDGGPTHSYENKQINMSARCVRDYDNSYTSAGRALYYYGYNGTSLTVGFETNPSAHVARRGVIYSTTASSALEIADPSATTLESTDGATVTEDTTNPDADKIFEKLINYSGTTYLRVFLIFDDGSVAYGQRINM